tara:strand:- start:1815 stop:2039 length:225 start_codon:yes stop_codon:yes gene_type:complete
MKTETITYGVSIKVQRKSYQPIMVEYSETVSINHGESSEEAFQNLRTLIKRRVEDGIADMDNIATAYEKYKEKQ